MITKFITRRNGTEAAPGGKILTRIGVSGNKFTFKFRKQAVQPGPVTTYRILTESGNRLNNEASQRITTG
jgi:hypothetical protein